MMKLLKFIFKENQILSLSDEEKKNLYLKSKVSSSSNLLDHGKLIIKSWKNMKKNYLLVRYEDLIGKSKK